MKSYMVLLCIVCTIALPSPGHTADPGNIYLRFLEGDVQVKAEDTKEWLPASINMSLIDSDQIWVPDNGRAELLLRNGTITRLDKNTYLEILASENKLTRFYLGAGHVYGNTIVEKGNAVVFETPTGSFHAYARSVFRIDVSENEDSAVSVFQGELYADSGTGQMKIGAGERMVLKKNAQYPVLTKLAQADQWEQWNKQRDREFSRPESGNTTAYLPDELRSYSYDLNKNGQWVYEGEYGYVWMPTVIVVQDWSPYRVGRWVWMRGNYVWISYEPWGWVPYHYGRWAFINTRGWCWVPPRRGFAYWGPGYVGWVHTPTHISWVPLAPGEIYYGHGNYGPHSVNIKNVTIQNITVNRPVYKNIHVKSAVMTVHRDTFITGKPVKMNTNEKLFLKERRIMGAPEIRPGKATLMPVIKDIPKGKQPPSRIVGQELKTFRKNNPVTQIQNRTNTIAEPSGTVNQIRRMDGKRADVPQRTYNTPAAMQQGKPATGNQAVQKISQVLPQSLKTLPQQGTPEDRTIQAAKGQLASARSAKVQEKKSDTENKAPVIPAARQQSRMITEQQRAPAVTKQVQPPVSARFADVSVRKTDIAKNTSGTPAVQQTRTEQQRLTELKENIKPSPPARVQTPLVTSQTQLPTRPLSVTPQAQSLKKEDMQISAAPKEMPSREVTPRAERKGGR